MQLNFWCVAVVALWLAGPVSAATYTWNVGSGTWDDATAGNWTPSGGPPASTDLAQITKAGSGNVTVEFASTNFPVVATSPVNLKSLNRLVIGNSGSGTNTLTFGTGAALKLCYTYHTGEYVARVNAGGAFLHMTDSFVE